MGEVSEVEQLRAELREIRYLTKAVLMSIVGSKKTITWEIEARVQDSLERERRGTPLRQVGVKGRAHDTLTSSYGGGLDIMTLEELAKLPREKVTSIEGVGRKTLQKIETAMAEHGLAWAEGA